jgi:hypothetical protein
MKQRKVHMLTVKKFDGTPLTREPLLFSEREAALSAISKIASVNLIPGKRMDPNDALMLLNAAGIAVEITVLPLYSTSADALEDGALEDGQVAFTLSGV